MSISLMWDRIWVLFYGQTLKRDISNYNNLGVISIIEKNGEKCQGSGKIIGLGVGK